MQVFIMNAQNEPTIVDAEQVSTNVVLVAGVRYDITGTVTYQGTRYTACKISTKQVVKRGNCPRCSGTGTFGSFGVCYRCNGTGNK